MTYDLQRHLVATLTAQLSGGRALVPEAGRDAWRWFADLCGTRTYHANGPNPIGYAEIEAYGRLMGLPFAPHHVALIRALDAAWLAHARVGIEVTPASPLSSGQAVNPAAFDAVFG